MDYLLIIWERINGFFTCFIWLLLTYVRQRSWKGMRTGPEKRNCRPFSNFTSDIILVSTWNKIFSKLVTRKHKICGWRHWKQINNSPSLSHVLGNVNMIKFKSRPISRKFSGNFVNVWFVNCLYDKRNVISNGL